jgi:hypothetical protein
VSKECFQGLRAIIRRDNREAFAGQGSFHHPEHKGVRLDEKNNTWFNRLHVADTSKPVENLEVGNRWRVGIL